MHVDMREVGVAGVAAFAERVSAPEALTGPHDDRSVLKVREQHIPVAAGFDDDVIAGGIALMPEAERVIGKLVHHADHFAVHRRANRRAPRIEILDHVRLRPPAEGAAARPADLRKVNPVPLRSHAHMVIDVRRIAALHYEPSPVDGKAVVLRAGATGCPEQQGRCESIHVAPLDLHSCAARRISL